MLPVCLCVCVGGGNGSSTEVTKAGLEGVLWANRPDSLGLCVCVCVWVFLSLQISEIQQNGEFNTGSFFLVPLSGVCCPNERMGEIQRHSGAGGADLFDLTVSRGGLGALQCLQGSLNPEQSGLAWPERVGAYWPPAGSSHPALRMPAASPSALPSGSPSLRWRAFVWEFFKNSLLPFQDVSV